MKRRPERSKDQRKLDIERIVEMKRSGRTSEEIARALNAGREPDQRIGASAVRRQWAAYLKRFEAKTEEDARGLVEDAIRQHLMDRAEALRLGARYADDGNPSAPSFFLLAHRAQLQVDRLRGVKPIEMSDTPTDSGEAFETVEEARRYLQQVGGLGARVIPYSDRKRGK